jgi:hypothetical protein
LARRFSNYGDSRANDSRTEQGFDIVVFRKFRKIINSKRGSESSINNRQHQFTRITADFVESRTVGCGFFHRQAKNGFLYLRRVDIRSKILSDFMHDESEGFELCAQCPSECVDACRQAAEFVVSFHFHPNGKIASGHI